MRKAMNIICGILAELCALAVIFLGAYLAYDAKASSLDQSYVCLLYTSDAADEL